MQLKLTLIGSIFLLFSSYLSAQNILVSGIVYDEEMEAMIGANIFTSTSGIVKGSSTDIEGHFSLDVPVGQPLVFSYLGYKDIEIPAEELNQNMVVIFESSAIKLDPIVVIGYGISFGESCTWTCGGVIAAPLPEQKETKPLTPLRKLAPAFSDLKVYPNPTTGPIRIENDLPMKSIAVYDATGKLLYNFSAGAVDQYEFDCSGLAAGMYYLQVDDGSGAVKQSDFVLINR